MELQGTDRDIKRGIGQLSAGGLHLDDLADHFVHDLVLNRAKAVDVVVRSCDQSPSLGSIATVSC